MNTTPEFVISRKQAEEVSDMVGTPTYVYDAKTLMANARTVLNFPNAYGLLARYAMKANPNGTILRLFDQLGLHIDASTTYEAERAVDAGIHPRKIQLTAQVIHNEDTLAHLVSRGMSFNATSLHQLEIARRVAQGKDISIRINPGEGDGGSKRTTTGGPDYSFGIWHEEIPEVKRRLEKYGLNVTKLHTHIGSGTKPESWQEAAKISLALVEEFPEINVLNLGGGFKVDRMDYEKTTGLVNCGMPVKAAFEDFYERTGRQLGLEIEPGTYLSASAGVLLATVMDIKRTTPGNEFLIVDSGMTEALRIPYYGAQHPLTIVPKDSEQRGEKDYFVSGHCCESGDTLTPRNPEDTGNSGLQVARTLTEARIGDRLIIGGCGAYCESMSTVGYNHCPPGASVFIDLDDKIHLINRRAGQGFLSQREICLEDF